MEIQFKSQKGKEITEKWLAGLKVGYTGKTRRVATFVRHYMLQKHGRKCQICGWDKINPSTGNCPVEIDHIDGDSENCSESNLRVVCPNCHSLTPTFRNLNKGRGKRIRRDSSIGRAGLL